MCAPLDIIDNLQRFSCGNFYTPSLSLKTAFFYFGKCIFGKLYSAGVG